jgi:hypothetical protein
MLPLASNSQQIKGVPVVKLFDKEYYKYEITKKESVFSICKKFKVTQEELLSLNPFIVSGLKAGQSLLIPIINGDSSKNETKPLEEAIEIKSEKDLITSPARLPRIAVLLPFALSDKAWASEKYVEFYEGLLIAVDSLKSEGLSFEVQTFDVGFDAVEIRKLIESDDLNQADYVVGGVSNEQINILSAWSKEKNKYLILPFSSKIPAVETNPFIFQTNTPYSYIYKRLSDYLSIRFAGRNIIFVEKADKTENDKSELQSFLKSGFTKVGLKYSVVTEDEELTQVTKLLSDTRQNLIVPDQLSLNESASFITKLRAIAKRDTTKVINLLGYPEWQALPRRVQPYMHELNTIIYSNFFADYQNENVRQFPVNFTKVFGKDMINTYPKYGMMGFDIASWFIPRMVYEKTTTPMKKGPDQLQNDYTFKSDDANSGSVNRSFYLINYTPENTIEVKQMK